MVDKNLVWDVIEAAEILCDTVRDTPAGCDGCRYCDPEDPNWKCPLEDTIEKLNNQLRDKE